MTPINGSAVVIKKIEILMVCYEQLDLTIKAINTLVLNTDPNTYRLWILDNSKSDLTKFWINDQRNKLLYNKEVTYLHFDNVGWIQAINSTYDKYISKMDSDYILTTHNDIEFEQDWFSKMLVPFSNDKVAMVGPTSNFILGLQSINFNLPGVVYETSKFICGLFCIFRKSIIDKLIENDGFFMDPRFGMGDKEELDYALRLTSMGYKFVIARNVYIKHVGEKGFIDHLGSQKAFYEYQDEKLSILKNKYNEDIVYDLFTIDTESRLRVIVGLPIRNNYVHFEHMSSMLAMIKAGAFHFVHCIRNVIDDSRNKIVNEALRLNATHVLFIDDDMIFSQNAAIKLLNHDVDIVCGLAFRRKAPYDPCIFKHKPGLNGGDMHPIEAINKGLVEIDACGSAFILIKTEVFKKMPEPWYKWGDRSLGVYTNQGGLGEDMSFTMKAKRLGFGVYCDTDLIITHLGEEEKVTDKTYLKYKAATYDPNKPTTMVL